MNLRKTRTYINRHVQDLRVNEDLRSSVLEQKNPDAIVWIGFNNHGEEKRLLPILITTGISREIGERIKIYKNFGVSEDSNQRIATPVYTTNSVRQTTSEFANPEYMPKIVTPDEPLVESVNVSGAREYARMLANQGQDSVQIEGDAKYSDSNNIVNLSLKIHAPGAHFVTRVPFFVEDPSDSEFESAIENIQIPCIVLDECKTRTNSEGYRTHVKLPYVSD